MISQCFTLYRDDIKGSYVVDFDPKYDSKPCMDSIDVYRVTHDRFGKHEKKVYHPEVLQVGLENIEKQLSFRGNRLRAVK